MFGLNSRFDTRGEKLLKAFVAKVLDAHPVQGNLYRYRLQPNRV
jgi:hypothetical protein